MIPPLSSCTVPYLPGIGIRLEHRILFHFFPQLECCSRACMDKACCRALSWGSGPIHIGGILLWREAMPNEPLTLQYVTCSVFLTVPPPPRSHAWGIVWTSGTLSSTSSGTLCHGVPCLGMVMASVVQLGNEPSIKGSESGALVPLQTWVWELTVEGRLCFMQLHTGVLNELIKRVGSLSVLVGSIALTSGMSCHFGRHLCFNCCCLPACGAKGQCIVAHSVARVNLYATAHDWVSQSPFVKSFCLVFIIYSPSLKHEMWLGAWPSQLCSHVSSKCAVCGSCSITSSLKSEWCLVAHGTVSWEDRLSSVFNSWEE